MAFGADKMQIVVEVSADGAIRVLDKLGEEIKGVEQSSKAAQGGISKFQANLLSLEAAASLAQRAFSVMSQAVRGFADGIQRGSRVDDITSSFERLSFAAGASGEVLLSKFGAALGNTIPKVEQMRIANELLVGGIDPAKFEILGKAARSLAEATGTSAAEGMERLNDSLLRGNTRALKSIGIIIDETAAVEALAKQYGKQASEITELGRVTAIREASIAALTSAQGRLGDVTDDAGDKIDQLTSSLENAKDGFWKTLSANEDVNNALDNFKTDIENIDWTPITNGIGLTIRLFDQLTGSIAAATRELIKFASEQMQPTAPVGTPVGRGFYDFKYPEASDAFEEIAEWRTGLKEIDALLEVTTQSFNNMSVEIQKTGQSAQKSKKDVEGLFGKSSRDALDKEVAAYKQLRQSIEKIAPSAETLRRAAPFLKVMLEDPAKDSDTMNRELAGVLESMQKLGIPAHQAAEAMAQAAEDAQKYRENVERAANAGPPKTEESKNYFENLSGDIGSSIANAITTGIKEAKNGSDWKKVIGGIGSDIGASIGNSLGTQLGDSLGTLMGSSLGEMFGPIGGAIGSVVGQTLVESVVSVFQSTNAGKEARKAADKFFADMFEKSNITAIIEGELKRIEDLKFSGNWQGNGFYADLEADARTTFDAVGTAFEQMLAEMGIDADELMGQLGSVFANNLGGSLENLRVMLEATGKTIEEMGDALFQAFLNGTVSAAAFLIELQKINGIMGEKGIIGKTGAVGEAWERLNQAGFSGGRTLLDAISGIGQELLELGASTSTMRDILVNDFGIAANEVEAFMEAMRIMGITSIEELVNASNEQLAGLAGNMESILSGNGPIGNVQIQRPKIETFSAPRSSGAPKQSEADKAAEEAKRFRDSIIDMMMASEAYDQIVKDLNSGLISQKQATKLLDQQYDALYKTQKKIEKTEKALADALVHNKKNAGALAKELERLRDRMNELTGKDEGSSGEFNAEFLDFLEKFEGQIDLISLAAEQAGVSFETMKNQAIQGFLSGAETATEAWKKLQDIGPGVAGMQGAVGEDYRRMLEAGKNGGIVTLNYLRGLAKETKEMGGTTFDDMIKMLLAQGVSETEASKVMSGIRNAGVTSLDALEKASDETAINILRLFEESGVPLKNTAQDIKDITKELSEIPPSKTIKISLERGNIDPALEALLKRFGLWPKNLERSDTTTATPPPAGGYQASSPGVK